MGGARPMEAEASYEAGGKTFRVVAKRKDLFFGNGLSLCIYADDGSLWAKASCNCHLEFDGFDTCQAMKTEQLLAVAIEKLVGGWHASIESSLPHGINTLCRLNG